MPHWTHGRHPEEDCDGRYVSEAFPSALVGPCVPHIAARFRVVSRTLAWDVERDSGWLRGSACGVLPCPRRGRPGWSCGCLARRMESPAHCRVSCVDDGGEEDHAPMDDPVLVRVRVLARRGADRTRRKVRPGPTDRQASPAVRRGTQDRWEDARWRHRADGGQRGGGTGKGEVAKPTPAVGFAPCWCAGS